jgi:hypothetical protein
MDFDETRFKLKSDFRRLSFLLGPCGQKVDQARIAGCSFKKTDKIIGVIEKSNYETEINQVTRFYETTVAHPDSAKRCTKRAAHNGIPHPNQSILPSVSLHAYLATPKPSSLPPLVRHLGPSASQTLQSSWKPKTHILPIVAPQVVLYIPHGKYTGIDTFEAFAEATVGSWSIADELAEDEAETVS